jgi:copper transport protein
VRRALVVAVVALAFPAVAQAHAQLLSATPPTQSKLDTPPKAIVLRFDQAVTITSRAIEVFTASGRKVSGSAVSASDGRVVQVALTGLKKGEAYTVRWRATSSDGHTGSGVYTFGIGVKPPPPTEAFGSTGPNWADDAARWAFFVSLALLVGTTGLRLLVLREPVPPRLSNRLYGIATFGGLAVLNVGIAAFVMRASDALQVPFVDLLYGDLSPIATKTRFGVAFVAMTLGYALVTGLVLLSWIFDRPSLLWPAFLVGIGFATGLSLSGHQGVEPNSTFFTGLADWLHLVAAMLWVGGLVALATCVWPLAPDLRRGAFLGFSRIATLLVAVLVLAGTYLSIERLTSIDELWTTGYGQALLAKLAIVSVALTWGAVHHFVVRPRLERGETPGPMRRSLLGESTIAILVLLFAAVLVNERPPPVKPTSGVQAGGVQASTAR